MTNLNSINVTLRDGSTIPMANALQAALGYSTGDLEADITCMMFSGRDANKEPVFGSTEMADRVIDAAIKQIDPKASALGLANMGAVVSAIKNMSGKKSDAKVGESLPFQLVAIGTSWVVPVDIYQAHGPSGFYQFDEGLIAWLNSHAIHIDDLNQSALGANDIAPIRRGDVIAQIYEGCIDDAGKLKGWLPWGKDSDQHRRNAIRKIAHVLPVLFTSEPELTTRLAA